MSFFSKIGAGIKKVVGKVGNALNSVAKVAAASGIPIVSSIGAAVDAVIPDKKIEPMVEKVMEQGVVKTEKVEETVTRAYMEQGIQPTQLQVATVTNQLTTALSDATGAPITDSGATVKTPFLTKLKAWVKAKWYFVVGGLVALVAVIYFATRNKRGGRRRRR